MRFLEPWDRIAKIVVWKSECPSVGGKFDKAIKTASTRRKLVGASTGLISEFLIYKLKETIN